MNKIPEDIEALVRKAFEKWLKNGDFEKIVAETIADDRAARKYVLIDKVALRRAVNNLNEPVEDSPLWSKEDRLSAVSNKLNYFGESLGWKD